MRVRKCEGWLMLFAVCVPSHFSFMMVTSPILLVSIILSTIILIFMKRHYTKLMAAGFLSLGSMMAAAQDMEQTFATINIDQTCYLNCTSEVRATWAQIEEKVLSQIGSMGYTKGQFEAEYELETYDGVVGSCAVQFEKTWVDGKTTYVKRELTDTIGEMKYTTGDVLGKQTNVLEWSFGRLDLVAKAITGKSDYQEAREQLINTHGQGLAGQTLTGTVRFVRKNLADKDYGAVYADIVIPAQNVFVAYAQVTGKFVSSFYNLNTNELSSTEDAARELHVSTPIPFITHEQNLTGTELRDQLRQYFRKNMLTFDQERFSAFSSDDVQMRFTLPSVAHGNAAFNADEEGRWTVEGVSGHTYTLALNEQADAICVVSIDGGENLEEPKPIVSIENGTEIVWVNGTEACDILNLVGQYSNQDGSPTTSTFMGSKQTFAAYLELYTEACYEMLLDDRFFNVRFVRPIDLTAKSEYLWARTFDPHEYVLHDLVSLHDWRGTEVVWQQQFRDEPDYKHVGHDFYGIHRLYTSLDDIRSDYNLPDEERIQTTDVEKILQMDKIADINQLAGYVNVENIPAETSEEEHTDYAEEFRIVYQNKGGEARRFHIYVPVTVDYAWGQTEGIDGDVATQRVWAVLDIEATSEPTGISQTDVAEGGSHETTFTIDGHQVKSTSLPALYVVKGRKFVVK